MVSDLGTNTGETSCLAVNSNAPSSLAQPYHLKLTGFYLLFLPQVLASNVLWQKRRWVSAVIAITCG